jgi:hypothetical protein
VALPLERRQDEADRIGNGGRLGHEKFSVWAEK